MMMISTCELIFLNHFVSDLRVPWSRSMSWPKIKTTNFLKKETVGASSSFSKIVLIASVKNSLTI
jgi:hypothetical protein